MPKKDVWRIECATDLCGRYRKFGIPKKKDAGTAREKECPREV